MSTEPAHARASRPSEQVAGYLAAFAIAAGVVAMVWKPVRVGPVAIVVALLAAAMGGRHERLAAFAVAVAAVAWLVGMIVAIATDRALW